MKQVMIYHTDDWSALFINGKKVYEQHQIRLLDLNRYCPDVKVGDIEEQWLDSAPLWTYLSENGVFPSTENELNNYL